MLTLFDASNTCFYPWQSHSRYINSGRQKDVKSEERNIIVQSIALFSGGKDAYDIRKTWGFARAILLSPVISRSQTSVERALLLESYRLIKTELPIWLLTCWQVKASSRGRQTNKSVEQGEDYQIISVLLFS